jgi:hypothetical protein
MSSEASTAAAPLTAVDAYDPAKNTWTAKPPLLTARTQLAAGVVNGVLFAVGGFVPGNPAGGAPISTLEALMPAPK